MSGFLVKASNGWYLSDRGGAWDPNPKDAHRFEEEPLARKAIDHFHRIHATPELTVVDADEAAAEWAHRMREFRHDDPNHDRVDQARHEDLWPGDEVWADGGWREVVRVVAARLGAHDTIVYYMDGDEEVADEDTEVFLRRFPK